MNPPSNAAWGAPIREDQVVQAVRFLMDPRTSSSSQSDRESFLRQKGLTDAEIAAAISRANPALVQSSSHVYVPAPISDEPIIWSALKSIFSAIGSVAIGVVGYHMYAQHPPSEQPTYFPEKKNDSYEKLSTAISELASLQELRHKEILMMIKSDKGAKLGLSLQLPDDAVPVLAPARNALIEDVPKIAVPAPEVSTEVPLLETSLGEKASKPAVPLYMEEPKIDVDVFNMKTQVSMLISEKLDSIAQLIASAKHPRKLNVSNPKFVPLMTKFPSLLTHCGFVLEGNFWINGDQAVLKQLVDEIQLQKSENPIA